MVFDYKRERVTVEAYGKVFDIPPKTAFIVDGVAEAEKRIEASKNSTDVIKACKEGIALFIGESEAEAIFPADKLDSVDTDEISAFWWFLNEASNKNTEAVIKKYSPNRSIRKSK